MRQQDSSVTFSVGNFKTIDTFRNFFQDFAGLQEAVKREQRNIIVNRKRRHNEEENFGFMKFLFTNPRTV